MSTFDSSYKAFLVLWGSPKDAVMRPMAGWTWGGSPDEITTATISVRKAGFVRDKKKTGGSRYEPSR